MSAEARLDTAGNPMLLVAENFLIDNNIPHRKCPSNPTVIGAGLQPRLECR